MNVVKMNGVKIHFNLFQWQHTTKSHIEEKKNTEPD